MEALDIPAELTEDILSKVPVKSLVRFNTTSKNWHSLLCEDSKFANFHLKRSSFENLIFFQINLSKDIFGFINIETNASRSFKFPGEKESPCELIGSTNGLVCIAPYCKGGCFIWNPCTGEYKKVSVPLPTTATRLHGFGYDSCSDDYKIVADWGLHFRVFSLKTNSWKMFAFSFDISHNAFQFNGALHWCAGSYDIFFDFATEKMTYMELPEEIKPICRESGFYAISLQNYQGLLCVSGGNIKSWAKLTCLANINAVPVGFSRLGEVVYLTVDGSGIIKSDIQGEVAEDYKSRIRRYQARNAFAYTESLISPRCFDGQPQSKKMLKRPRKQRKTNET